MNNQQVNNKIQTDKFNSNNLLDVDNKKERKI